MKRGTRVSGQLIADERFLGNFADVETLISVQRTSLKTAVHGEGIEIYHLGEERVLDNWQDCDKKQIRQSFELILSKPLSKDRIYQIVNQVQPQPLKFY